MRIVLIDDVGRTQVKVLAAGHKKLVELRHAFSLRGEAIVRTRELRDLLHATLGPNKHERLLIEKRDSGG